jgi:hypothetical protein
MGGVELLGVVIIEVDVELFAFAPKAGPGDSTDQTVGSQVVGLTEQRAGRDSPDVGQLEEGPFVGGRFGHDRVPGAVVGRIGRRRWRLKWMRRGGRQRSEDGPRPRHQRVRIPR